MYYPIREEWSLVTSITMHLRDRYLKIQVLMCVKRRKAIKKTRRHLLQLIVYLPRELS